ncbi:hypothetical protein [Chryseobacterium oryctis]|uniref:Uncharacterized protein n=1 Tax=Chryseobacterium oryctis TaxID=2952618 RepID=A0ABT3HJQ5_9FLAO|nr:hypothetical protein [Chryseobacterium oryctis]MCW3160011.1 hypothetical protein [Chryseobacterium oryctis]
MKNIYNKGTFRNHEWGKIPSYLKKLGNKKWRRTEVLEIEDQLKEFIRFYKKRKKRRKIIWAKITTEIRGRSSSDYRSFYSEKSFKDSIRRPNITRYYIIKQRKK